jgi:hypothetical protein
MPEKADLIQFTWTCLACGISRTRTTTGMSVVKPPEFHMGATMSYSHDLHDYQGAAVAGHKASGDLCDSCLTWLQARLTERAEATRTEATPSE